MLGLPAQIRYCIAAFACLIACALPAIASADSSTGSSGTSSSGTSSSGSSDPYTQSGGTSPDDPQYKPHGKAILLPNGQAIAPTDAPPEVVAVIEAANKIATLPYIYGGGHNATFSGRGYDCSGSVSYALAAGGLLGYSQTSGQLMSWGAPGPGHWLTIYANQGHVFMYVAGLRFDTSGRAGDHASRWQLASRSAYGFVARHYPGL